MSWRLPGRPSSISSTRRVPPSARVSTSCNTKPIHHPPAGNGPAGHIAPAAHPQSLDTPVVEQHRRREWADPDRGRTGPCTIPSLAHCASPTGKRDAVTGLAPYQDHYLPPGAPAAIQPARAWHWAHLERLEHACCCPLRENQV